VEEQDYRTTYELEEHNWWFVGMRRMCFGLLDRGLRPDPAAAPQRRILDVGCGTGITLEHLEPYGLATGLDYSSTALEFCRKRGAERLVQGSGDALPFSENSFDAVTAFGVIEHIDADAQAISEWARVLKPGGDIVVLTSAYQWMWSGHDVSNHHTRRYLTKHVGKLLQDAGLEVEKLSYVNTLLFPLIAVVRLIDLIRRRGRPPEPHKDTGEVPALANKVLERLLDLENRVLQRGRLPFGVSIIARATKPFPR
jgi:SAM-dependent methyltransferase